MTLRALAACVLLATPSAAGAQQGPPSRSGQLVLVGETPWAVVQEWDGQRASLEIRGPSGSRRGALEAPGFVAAASNDHGILVGIVHAAPAAVRALWVPIADGRPGTPAPLTIARVAGDDRTPVGISVTARPDGFAVIWQEGSTASASALWQTFEARFGPSGQAAGTSRALGAVSWPIADVVHLGGRYLMLLYFGGASPEGTRLCAVHVDESGRPQEHPWWASRPGVISEARLVVHGARAIAVYRGGLDGRTLLEADVTEGAWAREAPEPRRHGAIAPDEAYGLRADGARVRVERLRLGR